MDTLIIWILGIALLLLTAVGVFYLKSKTKEYTYSTVKVGNKEVKVEIADTGEKRAKGLMFREILEKDSGMLFIFPVTGKHSFWMANTKIALDIIWINTNKEIVYIKENTPPCASVTNLCKSYKPSKEAKYVLEVNSGWVKNNNIKLGDSITL